MCYAGGNKGGRADVICQNCQSHSSNIRLIPGVGERCHVCGDFSEAGGTKSTGLLTRQSDRIRMEQARFAGDLIPPHAYDKASRKFVPNPDFIAQYPDRAGNFHSGEELRAAHAPKLADHAAKLDAQKKTHKQRLREQVSGAGSAKRAMKKVIK